MPSQVALAESAFVLMACRYDELERLSSDTAQDSDLELSEREVQLPDGDALTPENLHLMLRLKLMSMPVLTSLRLCPAAASVAMHALLQ